MVGARSRAIRAGTSGGFFLPCVRCALGAIPGQMALFAVLRRATPVARERAPTGVFRGSHGSASHKR